MMYSGTVCSVGMSCILLREVHISVSGLILMCIVLLLLLLYREAVRRCYLEFPSADHAKRALESLNQQPIPGSSDVSGCVECI